MCYNFLNYKGDCTLHSITDRSSYKISNELLDVNSSLSESLSDRSVKKQTVTEFKINRAIIYKMQQKYSYIKDIDCEIEAIQRLKNKFEKLGFDITYKVKNTSLKFDTPNPVRDVMVSQVAKEVLIEKVNKTFEFDSQEIFQIANIKSTNAHYIRKKMSGSINQKFYNTVEHKVDDNGEIYESGLSFSIITSIRSERGKIKISVEDNSIPYLFGLTKNYTPVEMLTISRLTSVYSVVLYELLKKNYKIQKNYYYKLAELQNYFDIDTLYSKFKTKVIDVAVTELQEKTGMEIIINTKRSGKAIAFIQFIVKNAPFDKKSASSKSENELFAHFIIAKEIIQNDYTTLVSQTKISECVKLINKGTFPNESVYRKIFHDNRVALSIIKNTISKYGLEFNYEVDELCFTLTRPGISNTKQYVAITALESLAIIKNEHPETIDSINAALAEVVSVDEKIDDITDKVISLFETKVIMFDEERESIKNKIVDLLEMYSVQQVIQVTRWLKTSDGKFDLTNVYNIDKFIHYFEKLLHKSNVLSVDIPVAVKVSKERSDTNAFVKKLKSLDAYYTKLESKKSRSQLWIDTKFESIGVSGEKVFNTVELAVVEAVGVQWIIDNVDTIEYQESVTLLENHFLNSNI